MGTSIYNIHLLNNKNINAEILKSNFDSLYLKNGFEIMPPKGNISKKTKKTEIIVFYNPNAKWICVYYEYFGDNSEENIIKDISSVFKTITIGVSVFDSDNLSMILSDANGKTNTLNAGRFLEDVEFDENSELDFDEDEIYKDCSNEKVDFSTNITADMWNKILDKNNTFDELQSLLKEEYVFYDDLLYEISNMIGLDECLSNGCYYEESIHKPETTCNYEILRFSYILPLNKN